MPIFPLVSAPPSLFDPPTDAYQLISDPLTYLLSLLSTLFNLFCGSRPLPPDPIRLVCISDTHCKTPPRLPPGDVLIHAGDLTNSGSASEIQAQIDWLASLPYKHKVAIAGNHDSYLDSRSRAKEDDAKELDWKDVHYLQHACTVLTFPDKGKRRLNVYGAPQIPLCGGKDFAFQYRREEDAWSDTVPDDVDVLITHTPPRYHLDLPIHLGCRYLLAEVWRVRPKVHVFGHVHAGYGREEVMWDRGQKAYETLQGRRKRKGLVGKMVDIGRIWVWMEALRVVWYGIQRVLWMRVWGGGENGTVLVNASLTMGTSNNLGNEPQVVDI